MCVLWSVGPSVCVCVYVCVCIRLMRSPAKSRKYPIGCTRCIWFTGKCPTWYKIRIWGGYD